MNGRENLFRQQHWQLAERRRYLTDLGSLAARLRADIDALTREIDEAGGPNANPVIREDLPNLLAPLVERRDKLVGTVAEIDAQIVEAREAVVAAEQEVRVVEGAAAYRGFTFEDRRVRRTRRSL
jgi:chorismate mutase